MYKNYNIPDCSLVLNLDFDITLTHDARFISLFVDSIPDEEFTHAPALTGRPAHHPRMLLKMLLFAYSRATFSGRKIVQMNEELIPMKWLTHDEYICYRSINSFRVQPETSLLVQKTFIYFTFLLSEHGYLKDQALFVDGTKVEADANKYSFVWRKAVEKYEAKLDADIKALYDELIERKVALAMAEDELNTSQALNQMIQAAEARIGTLDEVIEAEAKAIKVVLRINGSVAQSKNI